MSMPKERLKASARREIVFMKAVKMQEEGEKPGWPAQAACRSALVRVLPPPLLHSPTPAAETWEGDLKREREEERPKYTA